MASNGTTNGNGRRYIAAWTEPRTLIALGAIILALVGWYFTVQGHCANEGIHHTCAELDARYVNEDIYEIEQKNVQETLARIERRVDKIADKLGVN